MKQRNRLHRKPQRNTTCTHTIQCIIKCRRKRIEKRKPTKVEIKQFESMLELFQNKSQQSSIFA